MDTPTNPAATGRSNQPATPPLATRYAASLQRIIAALNTTLISTAVATLALEEAMTLLQASAGAIMLLRDQGDTLEMVAAAGYPTDREARWRRFPVHTHPLAPDALRGQSFYIGSKRTMLKRYPQTAAEMATSPNQAFIFLPLPLENSVIGALTLSFPQRRSFPTGERAYLQALTQQCARAFERARLYETEHAIRRQAEQAAQRNAALQAVTAALSQALTPGQVGQAILDGITTILASETSAVALIQENLLHIVHVTGMPPERLGTPLTLDMPYTITEAARTGQAIYIENPQAAIQRYPHTAQDMLGDGRQAWAAIPFHIHDNLAGVLSIGFNNPHDFDEAERAIISALALQCAQALHRAFLYEQERAARAEADLLNNQLELQVAARTAELQWTNAELRAEITQRHQAEARLRESEARYRTLIETSPDAIILSDLNMQLLFGNQQAATLMGYHQAEELIGRNAFDLIAPESHAYAQAVLSQALSQGSVTSAEVTLRRHDGTLFPAEVSGSLLTDAGGRPFAFLTITRDISRRKAAEERSQREAARTAALARAAGRLTGRLELDELITAIGAETAQIFAVPLVIVSVYDSQQDAFVIQGGFGLPDWFLQQAQPIPTAAYRNWDYGRQGRIDRPYVVPDMRRLPQLPNHDLFVRLNVYSSASITMMREESLIGRLNICTIGEERAFSEAELQVLELLSAQAAVAIQSAQLYAQLRAHRQQLRRLNQRVITAQEEERQRLSRELHDSVGQMLTALNINISLLAGDVPAENTLLRQNLLEATTLSKEALDQIRSLARELRPVALGPTGLNAVLESFCQEFARRTRLSVTYEGTELPTIPDVVGISFYRFLQEGLTNVVKHANATHAQVSLTSQDGLICLAIEDNGAGVAPIVAGTTQQPAGVGLLGLRERFELLGGEIELLSTPGRGTRLSARLKQDLAQ